MTPSQPMKRMVSVGSFGEPSLSVAAPWYRAWWFYLIFASTVALAGTVAWRLRVAQLVRAQAAQQHFLRQLIGSQETERKRLAGELHDGLAQRLTIMKNLALLHLRSPAAIDQKRGHVEALSEEISGALTEVRAISYALRPYQLDCLGLKEAVEALVKSVAAASGIQFASRFDAINDLFAPDAQIHVYRIVQECLNNTVKHSHAQHAEVTMTRRGARVQIVMADDGVGFAAQGSPDRPRAGLGLTSISERVQLLGGSVVFDSLPGKGTTVEIDIPCLTSESPASQLPSG